MNQNLKTDVRDEIVSHLKHIERSLMWLSKKTQIPYGTIYSTLIQKVMELKSENLEKINKVLGTEF